MSETATFIELALRGDVMPDEIDDFIDHWHDAGLEGDLHAYLGLSWEEYSLWVSDAESINIIISARRAGQPIVEAVNDNLRHGERLAARADDAGKIAALRRWIAAQPDR